MKTYDRYDVLADGDVSQLYVVKTEHDAEIAELKAACKGWEDGHNQLWDEVAELKAENEVLREQNWMMNKNTAELRNLLADALPHIECTSQKQSDLITAIGLYLEAADKEGGANHD